MMRHRPIQPIRAFTLTEILVAVIVLMVVIAATSQIFSITSKVVGLGEANQALIQESSVVERILRQDLEALANEGYMLIQCVAVRNDAPRYWPSADPNAPLLDVTRPASEYLRTDRIVFFRHGQEDTVRFVGGKDQETWSGYPAATLCRMTYGHAVQMPNSVVTSGSATQRLDPVGFDEGPLTPWSGDNPLDGPSLNTVTWPTGSAGPRRSGRQPAVSDWILARSAVLLANDGGSRTHLATDDSYKASSAISLFEQANTWSPLNAPSPAWDLLGSRVDAVSSTIDEVQRTMENELVVEGDLFREENLPFFDYHEPWNDQVRGRLIGGTFGPFTSGVAVGGYPRAEKVAPSMDRQDQILVAPMLAGNCSSFVVDWTWDPYVGHEHYSDHNSDNLQIWNMEGSTSWEAAGYVPNFAEPRVWYGLPDGLPGPSGGPGPDSRGVTTLTRLVGIAPPAGGWSTTGPAQPQLYPPLWDPKTRIGPERIEGAPLGAVGQPVAAWPNTGNPVLWVYTATFGFNHDEGVSVWVDTEDDNPPPVTKLVARTDVTPLPSALRFTFRLYDPEKKLERGQEFQFVVELTRSGGRER